MLSKHDFNNMEYAKLLKTLLKNLVKYAPLPYYLRANHENSMTEDLRKAIMAEVSNLEMTIESNVIYA